VPSSTNRPDSNSLSAEELLLVLEARDAEVAMLKLIVSKLKLQLARRNRALFGTSSERFTDSENPQRTFLEPVPLDELKLIKHFVAAQE